MKRNTLTSAPQSPASRCIYSASNGARCRMLAPPGSRFCPSHDNLARQDATALAAELSRVAGGLSSPEQVRRFLAKIVVALVEDRVSARKAAVVGYLSQMLLQSQRQAAAVKNSEAEEARQNIDSGFDDNFPSAIRTRALQRNVILAEEALRQAKQQLAAGEPAVDHKSDASLAPPLQLTDALASPSNSASHNESPRKPASRISQPEIAQPRTPQSKALPSSVQPEQSSSARPEAAAQTPPPHRNHSYPLNPTLKRGLQDTPNAISSPDAEEARWHQISNQYATRRRRT